jgi:hypothetical protein
MTSTHTNATRCTTAGLSSLKARFGTPASGAMDAATSALAKGYVR